MNPLLRAWVVGLVGAWVRAGVASAETSEWESVAFPLQTTRASVSTNFDPGNPVIVVTYSNASPDYVLAVWTPKLDWEQVIHVPATVFDGKERRKEDYVRIDLEDGPDLLPRNWTNLMPGEVIRLSCVVSNRYRVPPEWETMAVDLGAQNQLVDERFVFDRTGKLLEVKVLRQRDLNAMKRSVWEYRRKQSSRTSAANVAAKNANPTNEWADAYLPVVECSVTLASDFDPKDPMVIVTYSNTSDRCPAYELVATSNKDRELIGPDVSFNGVEAEMISPELSYESSGEVEIPPMSSVSVVFRIRDKYEVPSDWSLMWISPVSANRLRSWWFEFGRSGRETRRGVYREADYEKKVYSAWRVPEIRERIRTDIHRYAGMRSNGIPWQPRIGTTRTPTGLANPVAWVQIVSNTIPYGPLPSFETNEASSSAPTRPPGRERVSRPPWWMWLGGIALAGLLWAAVRRMARGAPEKKD